MADGFNKAILIGNIGQDPELRYTQGGTAVMTIRMATNEGYADKNGEWKEKAEWHTVVVWGKRADGLSKILCKGDRIGVEGRIQTRNWEDKNGTKRYATEIVSSRILLLGNKTANANANGNAGKKQREPGVDDPGPGDPPPSFGNDDFPF